MNIVLENIAKAYDGKAVLSDFSAVFEEKKTTAVMGASGSGKTTLLRLLMGLEAPDGGSVRGVPKRFFAVFQEDRLCEEFTVEENIRMVLSKTYNARKIEECLEQLGISECKKQPVNQLSGGMKRRVAIARAILAADEAVEKQSFFDGMIVLDEPFKGLDEDTKGKVMAYVKHMIAGKTTILVTHEKLEADDLADTVFYLEG